jgi:hypothetical protein
LNGKSGGNRMLLILLQLQINELIDAINEEMEKPITETCPMNIISMQQDVIELQQTLIETLNEGMALLVMDLLEQELDEK